MKRGYVDTPEGQVHYQTDGEGETILLLHQVGLSSDQFLEIIPVLGRKYRAIAPDILGYGNSDMPPREYQMEDYARNIVNFLDALSIKKANLVGRAFGAALAVEIAVAYPVRVKNLVLSGCVFLEPNEQQFWQERSRNRRLTIKEDGSHLIGLWQRYLASPHTDLKMCHRTVVDYLTSGMGMTVEDGHRALFSYNPGSKLGLIKNPTLLLYGNSDTFISRIEALRSQIPRCRIKIIEGTRSFPTWEKPLEFSQGVLEFLENPGV